jgi:hypothetical protein
MLTEITCESTTAIVVVPIALLLAARFVESKSTFGCGRVQVRVGARPRPLQRLAVSSSFEVCWAHARTCNARASPVTQTEAETTQCRCQRF